MSAETYTGEVEVSVLFEMNDPDFELTVDDETFTETYTGNDKTPVKTDQAIQDAVDNAVVKVMGLVNKLELKYTGDLKYVGKYADYSKVATEVYVIHRNGSSELVYSAKSFDGNVITALGALSLSDEDEILVEVTPMIDSYSVGDAYSSEKVLAGAKADGTDDRKQTIVTIENETWSEVKDAGSGKFTTSYYVTDGKEATLVDLIEDSKAYDEYHRVGSGKDRKTYRLVWNINGDEATGEWDVRPDKDEDRFGEVKSTTPENTLDKNGDGIVTCDEYYGVTGLKWDDKKNACVTTSGNAVVTVPDTSAR